MYDLILWDVILLEFWFFFIYNEFVGKSVGLVFDEDFDWEFGVFVFG